ncbi:MAG: HD domain-containing protein [Rhizomicrobium sp.]
MTADEILAIYDEAGATAYFGEKLSVTEHSLQTAHLAQNAKAPNSLVIAALLHDIGHLVEPAPAEIAEWKTDAFHEVSGSRWLAQRFEAQVYEPVRLHVAAKRYLCTTDPAYFGKLSAASVKTLALQGGPMSRAETQMFEAEPYFREAVLLRRWDDHAKIEGLSTPDFAAYLPLIEGLAKA